MLNNEQNERLTRVGPGTPMGNMLRRYWHPIAALSQMNDRDTLPIKLLSEDLVLYRDLSGNLGLLEAHCPHRSMSLVYGMPTDCGLRCSYHGWAFDAKGACTEQPYEEAEDPSGRFKQHVKIKAYPVAQHGGMVLAYLGPEPVPQLPPWDLFVMDDVMREIGYAKVSCNWLQIMENSLDPVHVEWLHRHMYNYVVRKLGQPERQCVPSAHQKIGFDAFEHGIVKRRVLEDTDEDNEVWAVGHPVLFPNILKSGSAAHPVLQIRVPMDDETTAYWWYRCYTSASKVPIKPQKPEEVPYFTAPVPVLDVSGLPQWEMLDNNSGQDIVAWITQGTITDRSRETLGRSDKGIVLYRRQLEEAVRAVEEGRDPPLNVFRNAGVNRIDLPVEVNKLGNHRDINDVTNKNARTGNTTKYSPVLRQLDSAAE
jgi:5,5'-dehydrodivanillate O-demethylase oxygenase subunit